MIDREKARKIENHEYHSVIIRRNDEALRHPDDTLERAVEEGEHQHQKSDASLLMSSFAAGLIMGVTTYAVAFATALSANFEQVLLAKLVVALFYPLGFCICIMSGTQLFTEQTSIAVYPVLEKKSQIKSLIKLWGLVLVGNFAGTFMSSLMISSHTYSPQVIEAFTTVGHHFLKPEFGHILLSSILAGWLMSQGSWLVLSTPPSTSQLLCIYIVTFVIGIGGFHHSIAGSGEVFAYFFTNPVPEYQLGLSKLAATVVGNIIGGSVFVALLNYGHIRKY